MSVAEMKEDIVRKVILSDDKTFLNDIAMFISSKEREHSGEPTSAPVDIDAFRKRLTDDYGEVLAKLAQ